MNTSKTYIKMCEKAEEIQGEWTQPHVGDQAYLRGSRTIVTELWFDLQDKGLLNKGEAIWLPRQDQLQEMVKETARLLSDGEWAYRFGQWCFPQFPKIVKTSMEQLWLAFVMKTLYAKRWYNGEWTTAR